jgi:hypothetical protein
MVKNIGNKNIQLIISEEEINKRIDQIEKLNCDDDLRKFLIDALGALVALDRIVGLKNTTIAIDLNVKHATILKKTLASCNYFCIIKR